MVEITQRGTFRGDQEGTEPEIPFEASRKAIPSASTVNLNCIVCSSAKNDSISQKVINYKLQNTDLMANTHLLTTLITMGIIISTNSILFKLTSNDPTCLKILGQNTYVIEYVVSGYKDKNVKMEIFDSTEFILRKQNASDFTHTIKFSNQFGQICFSRTDGRQKSISFDYYPESDPARQIIQKKDLAIVIDSLHQSIGTLRQVGRNQKFHIERNEINRTILEQSENKIKWAGIIKIIFLITSALIQLFIMKSFFNRNSTPYQPVEQH